MSESPDTSQYRIPDGVTRDELIEASKPLLDLLGVTANEVYTGIYIGSDSITFGVLAPAADDHSDYPAGVRTAPGLADPPQEFAELSYHVTVRVVD